MRDKVARLFAPGLTLSWRGHFRRQRRFWWPDSIKDEAILKQLMEESGLDTKNGVYITPAQYELILEAAGRHGLCVETIGDPDDEPPGPPVR